MERLYFLFSQIEHEFRLLQQENALLRRRILALEAASDVGGAITLPPSQSVSYTAGPKDAHKSTKIPSLSSKFTRLMSHMVFFFKVESIFLIGLL